MLKIINILSKDYLSVNTTITIIIFIYFVVDIVYYRLYKLNLGNHQYGC